MVESLLHAQRTALDAQILKRHRRLLRGLRLLDRRARGVFWRVVRRLFGRFTRGPWLVGYRLGHRHTGRTPGQSDRGQKLQMGAHTVVWIGSDVLLSSGVMQVTVDGNAYPLRLTLAMVKVDGQWLIAQHHASRVPGN